MWLPAVRTDFVSGSDMKFNAIDIFSTKRLNRMANAIIAFTILFFAFGRSPYNTSGKVFFMDFDEFYVVGQMIWSHRLIDAYNPVALMEAVRTVANEWIFMPWAYPPQFNLLLIPLPLFPRWAAYVAFAAASVLFYFAILKRLCRNDAQFTLVKLLMLPGTVVSVIVGQNGFITAGLAGLFALAYLRGRKNAGVFVGVLSIKPHLALGIGFLLLITRQWRVLVVAAATALFMSVVATALFGLTVWLSFLEGARQASAFLEAGIFPLQKMASLYAALFPWIGAPKAMSAQIIAILVAGALIWRAHAEQWPPHMLVGFTLLASLSVSPYLYYYDLLFIGLFFALTADEIATASLAEKLALVALTWISMTWVSAQQLFSLPSSYAPPTTNLLPNEILELIAAETRYYSLAGVALTGLMLVSFLALQRQARLSTSTEDHAVFSRVQTHNQ